MSFALLGEKALIYAGPGFIVQQQLISKKIEPQMTDGAKRPVCGIVMPISAIDGCPAVHWSDVQDILSEAISDAGFEGTLVSNADEVGVIQKRIIQNLYDNPMIVCDVSGKNPNVMFELGMRLAFDRPTVIVKDDKTTYSFDTAPIEHIEYPRDLRFGQIVEFKERLAEKIAKTYEAAAKDSNYTTFLKHFGDFKVAKLDKKEVSPQEFMIDEIKGLRQLIETLTARTVPNSNRPSTPAMPRDLRLDLCQKWVPAADTEKAMEQLSSDEAVESLELRRVGPDHQHLRINIRQELASPQTRSRLQGLVPKRGKNPQPSRKKSK